MSGNEKKKRSLSKAEYSVLVSSVCFAAMVLVVLAIVAYKVLRVLLITA